MRTQVALVGRTATILCVTAGAEIDYPALQRELNAPVVEGSTADLPAPYTGAPGHVPPIGGPAGVLVVIDEQVTRAGVVVFRAFAPTAFMEIRYEELSRLETPRIAAFAVGGMLPEHGSP